MYYTSYLKGPLPLKSLQRFIKKESRKWGLRFQAGLGTLAQGVIPSVNISPAQLEEDLHFLKKAGIETAVLFWLGGLQKEYLDGLKFHDYKSGRKVPGEKDSRKYLQVLLANQVYPRPHL